MVPVKSIVKKLYKKPQYFNIIGGDGNLKGQILAMFYMEEVNK
jgi:hypothetical protein